ncbi:uncharacterized protein LOC113941685 [Corapipo altera]|uniref:uncharacterized protein LOC113941685 n=1 Tax=Corapipo altera TaxID=415028 RepID=UPI000FD65AA5|nr:uncharacterized protein LOC113941685 [Corapipo altera]
MKFVGSRRRQSRITPADVQVRPDTIPTQLKAKPDVSTASTAVPAKCDTATSDHTTHWDTTSSDDVSHCDSELPELMEEVDETTMEGVESTDATPVQHLGDTPSLDFLEERAVSAEVAITPDRDMQQRPPRVPKLAWVKEEEKEESPGAAPAQQPEEVQQVQPLQEDAGQERTEEQLRARGRFRRAAQLVCRFIRYIWQEEATFMTTGDTANSDLFNAQTNAALLDLLVQNGVYKAKQVPAIVRCIHQWLTSNVSDEHRLDKTLVLLTEAHPMDVAATLLRSAPACDRAARTMWKTLVSSRWTKEPVLQILFCVLEYWPAHRRRTSNGDERDVFALAVSFLSWSLLAPTLPLGRLSILPHHCFSLPQALGCRPALGASSGTPGWGIPLCLPWPVPATLGPCHMDNWALRAVSGCFVFGRQLWHSGRSSNCPGAQQQ